MIEVWLDSFVVICIHLCWRLAFSIFYARTGRKYVHTTSYTTAVKCVALGDRLHCTFVADAACTLFKKLYYPQDFSDILHTHTRDALLNSSCTSPLKHMLFCVRTLLEPQNSCFEKRLIWRRKY